MPAKHLYPLLLAVSTVVSACTDRKAATTTAAPAPTANCCAGTIYEVPEVEAAPSFPGGDAAMFAWVGNRLSVPAGTPHGTAWIEFNVECDGSLHTIVVKRAASPELDSAAVRLVRDMPAWEPGAIKGKAVCVQYLLPVKHGVQ
jgi:hypothetical protein